MKIIANKDRSIELPYQYDGALLLQWLQQQYPYSKYQVIETEHKDYNEMV